MVLNLVASTGWDITEVISGDAPRGVDRCALMKPWACPVRKMPAAWRPDGKLDRSAGFRRNAQMADVADALIAIWDGKSPGTMHMIRCMQLRRKMYHVFTPPAAS